MLKPIFFATAVSLLSSHCLATPEKPAACPAADALKLTTFSKIFKNSHEIKYVAYAQGHFGTKQSWLFTAGAKDALSEEEALEQINRQLPHLRFWSGPYASHDHKHWICNYQLNHIIAHTISPPPLATGAYIKLY